MMKPDKVRSFVTNKKHTLISLELSNGLDYDKIGRSPVLKIIKSGGRNTNFQKENLITFAT